MPAKVANRPKPLFGQILQQNELFCLRPVKWMALGIFDDAKVRGVGSSHSEMGAEVMVLAIHSNFDNSLS